MGSAGIEGERIQEQKIGEVCVKIHEAAGYRHRGVCIEGADTYENIADMIDYLPKIGMNEYFIQFLVPGTFFERWYHHEGNPMLEKEEISRDEIAAMTVSLEREILKRGLSYQKTGHGWTCEPFGIDGTAWNADRKYEFDENTRQYLAKVNGQRELWDNIPLNTELCYSNPKVREIMTDAITAYCKQNAEVDVLHFWLSDGNNNYCECDECIKRRPADWYMILLNELDAKLTAAGLKTRIVFLIYHGLLWEPQEIKLQNPERFILMFAPISRIYGQNYSDALKYDGELPPFVQNHVIMPESLEQNLAHLRQWQRDFKGDSFSFDYHLMWAHISDPGYEYCASNLFADMQDLEKIGLDGMVSCQIQRCFFPTALPFNMMAAALWNKKADYETEADAYYRAAYGQEGPAVRKYLKSISGKMGVYHAPARGVAEAPYCTDYAGVKSAIAGLRAMIQNSDAAAMYREAWNTLELFCEYAVLFVQAFECMETGDEEGKREAVKGFNEWCCRNELAVQKTLDVWNTLAVLNGRWNYKGDENA